MYTKVNMKTNDLISYVPELILVLQVSDECVFLLTDLLGLLEDVAPHAKMWNDKIKVVITLLGSTTCIMIIIQDDEKMNYIPEGKKSQHIAGT